MGCSSNNELTKSYENSKMKQKLDEKESDNNILQNMIKEQDKDLVKIQEDHQSQDTYSNKNDSNNSFKNKKKEESIIIDGKIHNNGIDNYLGMEVIFDGKGNGKLMLNESEQFKENDDLDGVSDGQLDISLPKIPSSTNNQNNNLKIPIMKHDENNLETPEIKKPPNISKRKKKDNIDINDMLYNNINNN